MTDQELDTLLFKPVFTVAMKYRSSGEKLHVVQVGLTREEAEQAVDTLRQYAGEHVRVLSTRFSPVFQV